VATWDEALEWLLGLGDDFGVDPVVYAVIYVGALPFFLLSLGWLVRTLRRRGPITPPLLSTVLFFLAPTLYVFVAGRNLPAWVYVLLVALTLVGAAVTLRRVRARVQRTDGP
jgi:hypothetical protein